MAKNQHTQNICLFFKSVNELQFIKKCQNCTFKVNFWGKKSTDFFESINLQGISYWNVKSNLGLTDRNMLIGLCLKVSVWSWDLDIWVLSTNFQKSNIDWPQQPPIEKVLKFSKNFHDSVKIILVLRLLNSRTRITLKSSVVIFQAFETSTASLTSVTSAASATSLASTASTAPFL